MNKIILIIIFIILNSCGYKSIYSNKNIKNRISRDFLEEKKSLKIIKFKKYIHDNKIPFIKMD